MHLNVQSPLRPAGAQHARATAPPPAPLSMPLTNRWTPMSAASTSARQPQGELLAKKLSGRFVVAKAGRGSSGDPWWAKDNPSNMKDVNGIQELVDALADAGDRLVIVEFMAHWCNACRGVFPKICKLVGERTDDVVFLKVNLDANRDMCKTMGVKVLPYFLFYRGAEGKVDQFSCTVSKIQRFKDALDAYTAPFCSLEPPAGVEEFPDVHPHPELHPDGDYTPEYDWGEAHEYELHPDADKPTLLSSLPKQPAAAAEREAVALV